MGSASVNASWRISAIERLGTPSIRPCLRRHLAKRCRVNLGPSGRPARRSGVRIFTADRPRACHRSPPHRLRALGARPIHEERCGACGTGSRRRADGAAGASCRCAAHALPALERAAGLARCSPTASIDGSLACSSPGEASIESGGCARRTVRVEPGRCAVGCVSHDRRRRPEASSAARDRLHVALALTLRPVPSGVPGVGASPQIDAVLADRPARTAVTPQNGPLQSRSRFFSPPTVASSRRWPSLPPPMPTAARLLRGRDGHRADGCGARDATRVPPAPDAVHDRARRHHDTRPIDGWCPSIRKFAT